MKRILVADDHEVVRKGIKAVLSACPDWEVCAEACNGHEAIAQSLNTRPDIVVMDIHMPGLNGLDATRTILASLPQTQVLILSAFESETLIREMLSTGARGYVLKSDVGEDLIKAVDALANGRLYFTSSLSEYVLDSTRRGTVPGDPSKPMKQALTSREREIVQLLSEGNSNKDVAARLGISLRTVETHRANVMAKLHAHSLSDLVRYAVQNEIIRP